MQLLGRRVAWYCASLVMAGALVAIVAGCGQGTGTPLEVVAPSPSPVPTVTPTPAPSYPQSLSYETWRASEPITIATVEEAQAALMDAGMGWKDAEALADAAASCEAPVMERATGTSIGILLAARGDGGLARGPFQIRIDAHPHLAARYDLDTLEGSAHAAVAIRNEAGSLAPWTCAR